jgi:nicotinamidase-related amidase
MIPVLITLTLISQTKTVEIPPYEIKEEVILPAEKTALIIVDMQNDFAHPKGSLYVPKTKDVIPNIKYLLEEARKKGVLVIFTQDWHSKDDPEFKIWPVHAVAGTAGAEIIRDLKPRKDEIIVKKLRYDAFYGTSLDHILRVRGIENVIVTGTVSNICVLHTAGSAALRWYKVILPIDAIAPLTEFDQEATIRQISFLYQGIITKTKGISFE